jgi:hypothetical protein
MYNYREERRKYLEGLRGSYNNVANSAISNSELLKMYAQVFQPYNTGLINHWKETEKTFRKQKKIVNDYYDFMTS